MEKTEILKLFSMIGAAFCIGLGAIGPAIGVGHVAKKALRTMGRHRQSRAVVLKMMFLSIAITSSCGVYSLLVGVLLICL